MHSEEPTIRERAETLLKVPRILKQFIKRGNINAEFDQMWESYKGIPDVVKN